MQIKIDLKKVFDEFYAEINHSHNENDLSYDNVLNTTAQTLSGAINELQNEINELKGSVQNMYSITINDGTIITTNEDYVLIERIDTDFTVSCLISVDSRSEYGEVGLGIFESLSDTSAITNTPGETIAIRLDNGHIIWQQFNPQVVLDYDHLYKLEFKREGDFYSYSIQDTEDEENIFYHENLIQDVDFKYVILWGAGELTFNYYEVSLVADYLLKTDSQTLVGAINELYDNQEFILTKVTEKINGL